MLDISYHYFRPNSYKYRISCNEGYYFCTGSSQRIQMLWGIIQDKIISITFDIDGNFIEYNDCDCRDILEPSDDLYYYDHVIKNYATYVFSEYSISKSDILIKRFWLNELSVGIVDTEDELIEYLHNPNQYTILEQETLKERLESWKEEDLFILWWQQDYYLDSSGEVTSS